MIFKIRHIFTTIQEVIRQAGSNLFGGNQRKETSLDMSSIIPVLSQKDKQLASSVMDKMNLMESAPPEEFSMRSLHFKKTHIVNAENVDA